MENATGSFWDHLDALRSAIIKIAAASVLFGVLAFCFKETLFQIVLAPKNPDFITYRILDRIAGLAGGSAGDFNIELINTGLARQFVVHMKTALCAGAICASPYILYQIFRFVSPALYSNERKYAVKVVGWSYLMFFAGMCICYFLIFPLTFRFLGTYQVSAEVENLISLDSYISTLLTMCLTIGLVFEIPILAWFFAKLGFLTAGYMSRYRKAAIIIILTVAAIITPTSDVFTLFAVSLPMWLLYEASILIVRRTAK